MLYFDGDTAAIWFGLCFGLFILFHIFIHPFRLMCSV